MTATLGQVSKRLCKLEELHHMEQLLSPIDLEEYQNFKKTLLSIFDEYPEEKENVKDKLHEIAGKLEGSGHRRLVTRQDAEKEFFELLDAVMSVISEEPKQKLLTELEKHCIY